MCADLLRVLNCATGGSAAVNSHSIGHGGNSVCCPCCHHHCWILWLQAPVSHFGLLAICLTGCAAQTKHGWVKTNQPYKGRVLFFLIFFWFFTHVPHRPCNLCKLSLFFSQRKCFFSLSHPRFLYPKSACKIEGPSKGLPCISSTDHTLVTVPPCPLLPLRQNGP